MPTCNSNCQIFNPFEFAINPFTMDVTYGLLSNLVKTRSIQRVLAPIASQISLLIILNESEDGSHMHLGEMVPCAKVVMQASHKLVSVAKQQAHSSTDEEFKVQMMSACEVLDLSSSNLYIASERLEASNSSKEARSKLVQASKDVLQGTMKVLLVADDAEIRRLILAMNIVTQKLSLVNSAADMQQLVHRFKGFTDALTVMTGLTDKRQRDMILARQRERIITSLNILKKSISSLSVALQNAVKYRHNPQAQMSKSYVITEIQTAMSEIIDAVQNRDIDADECNIGEPGKFVTSVDLALECLSEDKRVDLHIDLEMWTEEAVRHSMTVAHLCYDTYRDLIIATCQRVIQVKGRVIQMHRAFLSNKEEVHIREDFYDVCETLIDEFCELEKNVNISLLHLVVEYFKETTEPLERLVKKALHPTLECIIGQDEECVSQFVEHAEKICQIATLAAASSTDARRVQVIRSSVQRLEHLDPEIVPSVIALSRSPHNTGVTRHLKLLMKEWTFELTNLLQVMDEMTDPKMFMLVSERKVEDDVNTCNGCMLITDHGGFVIMLQSVLGRSRRVAQVAERIVDAHDDPMFRNGLMVFVQKLKKAITGVRTAGDNVRASFSGKQARDVMHKRFDQLQEALSKVKAGLKDSNHPHVLSPLRRNARSSEVKPNRQDTISPVDQLVKMSKGSRSLPHYLVDRIIATSVPRLDQPLTGREDVIQPQTVTSLKTGMGKSNSLGDMTQTPDTYAWRLASELVSWSTKGDKQRMNMLCGDLLGWTNHIADVSQSLLRMCEDSAKKKEIDSVCFSVDELTPELIESAKYVLHGDFSHLNTMKTQAHTWATQVEKVRVYVDIRVDSWKSLADKVVQAAKMCKTDMVSHQLEAVQGHYEALSDLVNVTERMRSDVKVTGQDKIEALWEDRNDLENVTVTFKTTALMITEQGLKDELVQVEQLGREWSVKVYVMMSTVENLCEDLLQYGQGRQLWPGIGTQDGIVEFLLTQNKAIRELLKSACYGNEEKKGEYKELLADMSDCVDDMKAVILKRKPATGVYLSSIMYTKLKVGLYRGMWIIKAIQCVDMARQQTCMYAGSIDQIIEKAFIVKAALDDKEDHMEEFTSLLSQFTGTVISVRKKVLSGIQLSTELGKRSAVRQCLDAINQLAPKVVSVLKTLAEESGTGCHGDVLWYRLQWCSKVYHLITCLQHITDIKLTVVTEVAALLHPKDYTPEFEDISERLTNNTLPSSVDKPKMSAQSTEITSHPTRKQNPAKSHDSHVTRSHGDGSESHDPGTVSKNRNRTVPNFSRVPTSKNAINYSGNNMFMDDSGRCGEKIEIFEPAVVNFDAIEEQIILSASKQLENSSLDDPFTDPSCDPSTSLDDPRSPHRPHTTEKPVFELLKTAHYIERETEKWMEDDNAIVKVAKTMASQIQHMTLYIKHEGPIKNHLGLVETAKAVARNSDKILHFANVLAKHCVDKQFSEDLLAYCLQVPLVRQQLIILANVQLGTANPHTADRILVQNAQNLMKRVLQTVSACEAVCIKGLLPSLSTEADSALLLATGWKKRHLEHRQQDIQDSEMDDLGLRVVEGDNLPPTLTQIFQTT